MFLGLYGSWAPTLAKTKLELLDLCCEHAAESCAVCSHEQRKSMQLGCMLEMA